MAMDVKSYKTNATSVSFTVEGKSNELGQVIMAGQMKDGTFVALQQPDGSGNVVFSGVSEGMSVINRMIGTDYSVMLDLMTRAVNNRTRQRNYFQLQSSMLEGLISEDEFYKRIEENEDDYVVEEMEQPSLERVYDALLLSQNIKDVNNSEDFATLFSFDSISTDKELEKLENNGGL